MRYSKHYCSYNLFVRLDSRTISNGINLYLLKLISGPMNTQVIRFRLVLNPTLINFGFNFFSRFNNTYAKYSHVSIDMFIISSTLFFTNLSHFTKMEFYDKNSLFSKMLSPCHFLYISLKSFLFSHQFLTFLQKQNLSKKKI